MAPIRKLHDERGVGYRALLGAVVLQAVSDAQGPKRLGRENLEKVQAEARDWLAGPCGEWACESLDIDYYEFTAALKYRELCHGTGSRAYWDNKREMEKAA